MRLRAPLSLLLLLGCVRAPAPVTPVSPSAPADAYLMRKGGPFDFAAAVEGPPDAGLVLDMAHPGSARGRPAGHGTLPNAGRALTVIPQA